MKHSMRIIGIVVASSLLVSTCNSSGQDDMQTREGQWDIARYVNDEGDLVQPVDDTSPYLIINDDTVFGTTGCNSFSGKVTVGDHETFAIGPLASTLIGCDEARSTQERNIHLSLEMASTWATDGETATLSGPSGVVMELTMAETDLADTHWFVTAINNGKGGVQSVVLDSEPTLLFGDDGRLSGTTGCNDIIGTYEQNDSDLGIQNVGATKKACFPAELMEQEAQIIAALEAAHSFTMAGGTLTIMNADAATLITARRLPLPIP